MKLTEEQLFIREICRRTMINFYFSNKKCRMFGVINTVSQATLFSRDDAHQKMIQIPSIGYFHPMMRIAAYLATYYRPVSDALIDGKSNDEALKLWAKTKKSIVKAHPTRSTVDVCKRQNHSRLKNRMSAIAEFKEWAPDKYQRSNWNKCK